VQLAREPSLRNVITALDQMSRSLFGEETPEVLDALKPLRSTKLVTNTVVSGASGGLMELSKRSTAVAVLTERSTWGIGVVGA